MDKKKCKYCNKTLRNTKRIDFVDRSHHFKCNKKIQEEQSEKLLEEFLNFFKSHNILVRI